MPFPLTDTQAAYLAGRGDVFELGNVSTHAYLEFEGDVDVERLVAAWCLLVARHDMLRAVILPDAGRQRVLAAEDLGSFAVDIRDLRTASPEVTERELAAARDELSHHVPPADRWPLFDLRIIRLRDDLLRACIGFDGLVMDFASWHVVYTELCRLYSDLNAELPEIPGSFRDYVLAARDAADSVEHRESERYWRERLATLPPAPRLPLAVDPATVEAPRFVRRAAVLHRDSWALLKRKARARGLTPSAALITAYAEVVAAWSSERHFTLNVPRMNRLPLQPEVNGLVGEFATFTLLAVDGAADGGFVGRARRLQDQLWEDLSHHRVSGVWMLQELRRTRGVDAARMPVVCTSTLAWPGPDGAGLDGCWRQTFGLSQTPQVYLDAQLDEQHGDLLFNIDAVDAVFPDGLAATLFDSFSALLHTLAHDERLWEPGHDPELRPAEQVARHAAAMGSTRPIPDEPVQAALLARAQAAPERPAVISGGRTHTYGELLDEATAVAEWLHERGVGPGHIVGIVGHKGWAQVLAVLGSVFAGAAYLPLDPDAPSARMASLLSGGGVAAVVAAQPGLDACIPEGVPALELGGEPLRPSGRPFDRLQQSGDDLLYALFTSGSTGRPKAALIEHRGMVNALEATRVRFALGPSDVALGVTAAHHDMSAFDLFGVLGAGGTLVLPDADRVREPAHWHGLMVRHGVTVWNSVPAMIEMLLADLPPVEDGPVPGLRSLRLILTGGDWIPLSIPATVSSRAPGARFVSVGGPTETTLWNIWFEVDRFDPSWTSVPYGWPLPNCRYHVLDELLRARPDGVVGQMYCSGSGLARGYLDAPELTAEVFVRDPRTGTRLYRTGDLGRYLPNGSLEIVGRVDAQVKVRGQRIETGEIEAVLRTHPTVQAAVVVPISTPGRRDVRALVAHLRADGQSPTERELREYLRHRLPAHMVPAHVVFTEAYPLTPNGKVDRWALAELAAPAVSRSSAAPTGALERVLAAEWARGLGRDDVGADEDFFGLGGDSMLAARILGGIREIFEGERVSVRMMFETLTVAGMAEAMRAAESRPGRVDMTAELALEVAGLSSKQVHDQLARRTPKARQ